MGRKAGKIALGLGLITGALTGFLFAPEEGKKVRKRIAEGDTKGLLHDLAKMGDDLMEVVVDIVKSPSVVEAVDKAKDKAAEVAKIKREELDDILKEANKKADNFKKAVEKYVKEQKALLDKQVGKVKKKVAKKPTKKRTTTKKKTSAKKKAPAKKAPSKRKTTRRKKK